MANISGLLASFGIGNGYGMFSMLNYDIDKFLQNTISGWITPPDTNADLTSETNNTLSTPGIADTLQESIIIYDLGSSTRILLYVISSQAISSGSGGETLLISDDGTTYTDILSDITQVDPNNLITIPTKTKFIKFTDDLHGNTYTVLGFRAYLI